MIELSFVDNDRSKLYQQHPGFVHTLVIHQKEINPKVPLKRKLR